MLYSLLVAVIGLSFLIPFACYKAFYIGFYAAKEQPVPKSVSKAKKRELAEETIRLNQVLQNIDRFDGTTKGQVKIK